MSEDPGAQQGPEESDRLSVGYWLVGFVDLLGQQEAFLKVDEVWHRDPLEGQRLLHEALMGSVGTVRSMRKLLDQFQNAFRGTASSSSVIGDWRKARVRDDRWSDGIVLSTPLASSEDHNPINGVYEILIAIGSLALMHLAAGRPIRAGIAIGGGIEVDGELFGPALVKAYQLESKVAGSPRVVLGTELREFLLAQANAAALTPIDGAHSEMARLLLGLLVKDGDGVLILDFAGRWFQENLADAGEILKKAHHFAKQSREEHRNNPDKKLFERYSSVVRYLESRMPVSNLTGIE